MTSIFLPWEAAEAERRFIDAAREQFLVRFPNQSFDAPSWDMRHLRKSAHKASNPNLYFTQNDSTTAPMPSHFADAVKAVSVGACESPTSFVFLVNATRCLWEALVERNRAATFTWRGLVPEDCLTAEQVMLRRFNENSTYRHHGKLSLMLEVLAAREITRPMRVPFRTSRRTQSEYSLVDAARHELKMPSDQAICSVAQLYHSHCTAPDDRIMVCILALLFVTGMRIGEVLTLPVNCIVCEGSASRRRWGIRLHKEKGKHPDAVRWLTPKQGELARKAVRELRRLTEHARRQASLLEESPV